MARKCRSIAGELLLWQEELKEAALAAAYKEDPTAALPLDTACLVRDACMVCFVFGHSSLAQRAAVLRTIKASVHAHVPCEEEGCALRGAFQPLPGTNPASTCYGNRFVWTEDSGDGEGAELQIVAPHHKGSGSGVLLVGDASERHLLAIYELRARPAISKCDEEVREMFLDDLGCAFTYSSLDAWWIRVLR